MSDKNQVYSATSGFRQRKGGKAEAITSVQVNTTPGFLALTGCHIIVTFTYIASSGNRHLSPICLTIFLSHNLGVDWFGIPIVDFVEKREAT